MLTLWANATETLTQVIPREGNSIMAKGTLVVVEDFAEVVLTQGTGLKTYAPKDMMK